MRINNRGHRRWVLPSLGIAVATGILVGTASVKADRVKADHAKADRIAKAPLADLSPEATRAIESANHLSIAFRTVADRLLPSVVSIENRPTVATKPVNGIRPSANPSGNNPFQGTPFEDMFREFDFQSPESSPRGRGTPSPRGGIGSGVIIDNTGIILTNNHVVAGDGDITVRTHDGRKFVATNVWTDPKTDLAVVKIDGAGDLVAATLGDSDQTGIGEWVIALGQPFGLESTVTAGIISAKHRGIGITDRENFLQTDAAINPGNSGGPLVNLRGEVVGINTAIHSRSGGNNGIGFAVPSNLARWVSDQLIDDGSVQRAYLGVGIQPVTADLAAAMSVKPRGGVVVTDVYPDTPAAKAGLRSGDVIVRFHGKTIDTPQALQLAVERSPIGKDLMIDVMRNGKTLELTYEPTVQPTDFTAARGRGVSPEAQPASDLGIEIATLNADVAKRLGVPDSEGVVITSVREGTPADTAGLKSGMVIAEVERQKVADASEFAAAMKQAREDDDGILLLVRTENGSRFVVVKS